MVSLWVQHVAPMDESPNGGRRDGTSVREGPGSGLERKQPVRLMQSPFPIDSRWESSLTLSFLGESARAANLAFLLFSFFVACVSLSRRKPSRFGEERCPVTDVFVLSSGQSLQRCRLGFED